MSRPKPVVLAILDGWGVAPPDEGNAIFHAQTPNMDSFVREYPTMTLLASGTEVGLSFGEMGNSEVGHLNIGAGRVYYQTLPRINKSIEDGDFFENQAFVSAIEHAKQNKGKLHLVGLVSPGNVHASQEHCHTLLELAKKHKMKKTFVHAILDGRDMQRDTATDFVTNLQEKMKELKIGEIASMGGRYWGMDRDNRWDRIEKHYRAMVDGVSDEYYKDPLEAIQASYAKQVYDEEFVPVVIGKEGKPTATIQSGDAVIFFNFRPDRARQLTQAFVIPAFSQFQREYIQDLFFVTMAEYEKEIPVTVAFPPVVVNNCLAEIISKAGLSQYHLAETEKYAHVTFFLNGTIEDPFPKEERKVIPSPKVESYKEAPEMSAAEVTRDAIRVIDEGTHDVIMLNYANADMVAHTGDFEASKRGCEAVDKGLGKIAEHVIARGGILLVTADHGNAEEVSNTKTGDMDKEHSTNPVPFIIVSEQFRGVAGPSGDPPEGDLTLLQPVGMLADVAPTLLSLMGLEQPSEMSGRALM